MSELALFTAARDALLATRDDYETAYRTFEWPELEHFNWAHDYFDGFARGNPRIGLWLTHDDGLEDKLSFDELSLRSSRVANFLCAHGVQRGDVVLLMLGNVTALWETMLAAIKLGAVLIPATNMLTAADLLDRVTRGAVKHAVVERADVAKFAEIEGLSGRFVVGGEVEGWIPFERAAEHSADFHEVLRDVHAPLLRYFTSGTTSLPKLVEHSQQSYPVGHLSTMYWIGLRPGDVHWNISSAGWAKHAWSCFFAPWNAGACVFVLNQAKYSAQRVLSTLEQKPVDTLCAPPTVWRMLIQENLSAYAPARLREAVGAGEPLNPEVIERVRDAWRLTVRDGYGQTETTAQLGNTPGQRVKPGSVGRPLPGYRIALLDTQGHPTQLGEIAIELGPRPIGLMSGYAHDAAKTRAALGGTHYRTGDVASLDADGYFTFIGRADDIFKSSDYRISPFELESVLVEHPHVAEAAVVPSPEARRLNVPKAFVLLRQGAQPSEELAVSILRFARLRLAPFKRVRRVEFLDLPKTISGKIRRVQLRELEAQRDLSVRRANEYWEEDFPTIKEPVSEDLLSSETPSE